MSTCARTRGDGSFNICRIRRPALVKRASLKNRAAQPELAVGRHHKHADRLWTHRTHRPNLSAKAVPFSMAKPSGPNVTVKCSIKPSCPNSSEVP